MVVAPADAGLATVRMVTVLSGLSTKAKAPLRRLLWMAAEGTMMASFSHIQQEPGIDELVGEELTLHGWQRLP